MKAKQNNKEFLDPEKEHTLSEQECELISLYRLLKKKEQNGIFKLAFNMVLKDTDNKSPKK